MLVYDFTALRTARRLKGMKLQEVADILGVSAATVANIENGKVKGNVSRLLDLVKIYDLGPSDLFVDKIWN